MSSFQVVNAMPFLQRRHQSAEKLSRARHQGFLYIPAMTTHNKSLSMAQVLICGAAIVTLSMGVRHGFGLWLQPITQAQNWTRETFAFAIAIQNLSWGVFGMFAGMAGRPVWRVPRADGGSLFYAAGPGRHGTEHHPLSFTLTAGVLLGAAQAGTTYAVVYGVIGRQIDPAKRSWAMGVGRGRRLVRPVPDGAGGGLPDQQPGLAAGAAGAGLACC
jgi:hypothetical protein